MRRYSYISFYFTIILLSAGFSAASNAAEFVQKPVSFLFELKLADNKNLLLPSDVASSDKNIYVVDGGHHRIVVYNQKGQFQFTFGAEGAQKGKFKYPVGIDVANNGDIYVADSGNRRIQVFSSKGKFKRQFKIKSGRYLIRPIDVLVDEKKKEVFVSGNESHEIMVFSLNGKLKRSWGGSGVNEGEFRYPATLAHLKDGRVAAVDVLNSRIQVFEKKGDYSFQIADWGVTQGQVFRPKGIAFDSLGNAYVSDSYLNVVQAFSDEGDFLHVLDTGEKHKLFTPVGMVIDKNNRLYITEMRRHRVSVYQLQP